MPYHNQFRYKPIDRALHRLRKLESSNEWIEMEKCISKGLSCEKDVDEDEREDESGLEM